jgi:hypothetical protein
MKQYKIQNRSQKNSQSCVPLNEQQIPRKSKKIRKLLRIVSCMMLENYCKQNRKKRSGTIL